MQIMQKEQLKLYIGGNFKTSKLTLDELVNSASNEIQV